MLNFLVNHGSSDSGVTYEVRAFIGPDGVAVVAKRCSFVNGMRDDEFYRLRGDRGPDGEHPAWISRMFIPWDQLHRGNEKVEEVSHYLTGQMEDLGIQFLNARPETTHNHRTEVPLAASLIPAQEGGV